MSAYEDLKVRVAKIIAGPEYGMALRVSDAVLAETLRTLQAVTPDMEDAGLRTSYGLNTVEALAKDWIALLLASPLAPPAGAP